MTTENRRKEEKEAKTEDSGRNSVQPLNSAMVNKAEREESLLPDNQRYIHIPRIEGVVSDYNIQEAMKAIIRNMDRIIQQAIYQELVFTFEATFSEK